MIEKQQIDYEKAKLNSDLIISNLNKFLKDKTQVDSFLKNTFENFKENNYDFFDLSTKQKERLLYKAVNKIDFTKVTSYGVN